MPLVDNAWYVNYGDGSAGAGKKSWFDVGVWTALTTYNCGNIVRQTTPTAGNERVFIAIVGAVASLASEPSWTLTRGAKTTEAASVTWMEATGVAALNGDLTNTPKWDNALIKGQAITQGQVITNVAGNLILICTTAGTAGSGSEPSWAAFTNVGATTVDNTATWTTLGASFTAWSAPHARGALALTTNWVQAGNAVFVADNHAETQATALVWTGAGAASSPVSIYCVDRTVATPPTSSDLKTTATVTTTGSSAITLNGTYHINGIIFSCGSGAVSSSLGVTGAYKVLENCALRKVGTTSSVLAINVVGGLTKLINTTLQFGNTADNLNLGGLFFWENTASAVTGSIFPTTLINTGGGGNTAPLAILRGVDLSPLGSGLIVNLAVLVVATFLRLINCKLPASTTFSTPTLTPHIIDNIVSDSASANTRNERYTYMGTQTTEATIVRTGGASDGTTPISWKIVSTSNSKWIIPFESQPITIWNDSTAAVTSLTFYGTTTGGGVPNNDDIWIEVEYIGDASSPQGSFKTTTKANNLAASVTTNNSSDGSTWGGGGAGNGFKIVVPSFTPAQKGPFNITIKVAKASSTYYIDPRPSISGVTVSKSMALSPGVYANSLSSGVVGVIGG